MQTARLTSTSPFGRVALLFCPLLNFREISAVAVKKKAVDFEQSLQQLEALVTDMEKGELSLEESLKAFEAGIRLTRECQARLTEAEQKVQLLLEEQGQLVAQPFPDVEQL